MALRESARAMELIRGLTRPAFHGILPATTRMTGAMQAGVQIANKLGPFAGDNERAVAGRLAGLMVLGSQASVRGDHFIAASAHRAAGALLTGDIATAFGLFTREGFLETDRLDVYRRPTLPHGQRVVPLGPITGLLVGTPSGEPGEIRFLALVIGMLGFGFDSPALPELALRLPGWAPTFKGGQMTEAVIDRSPDVGGGRLILHGGGQLEGLETVSG